MDRKQDPPVPANARLGWAGNGQDPWGGEPLPSDDLAQKLWDRSLALTWVKDEDGRYLSMAVHRDDLGVDPANWIGRTDAEVHDDVVAQRARARDLEVLDGGGPAKSADTFISESGTQFPLSVVRIGFRDGQGRRYVCGVGVDSRESGKHLAWLSEIAMHDQLTGLYNRRGFTLLAVQTLALAQRYKSSAAVFYIDIDDMKGANERLGAGEGDALLVQTAQLLRSLFRSTDVIGRVGGDEFAVLVSNVDNESAMLLKDRMRQLLSEVKAPPGANARLALSCGVAWCAHGDGRTLAELVSAADGAMYEEKRRKHLRRTMQKTP